MSTNEDNTYVINPNQEITHIQAGSRHGFALGSSIPSQVMIKDFKLGLFFDTFDREPARSVDDVMNQIQLLNNQ